mgnify:CR=1 FL=1
MDLKIGRAKTRARSFSFRHNMEMLYMSTISDFEELLAFLMYIRFEGCMRSQITRACSKKNGD